MHPNLHKMVPSTFAVLALLLILTHLTIKDVQKTKIKNKEKRKK